MVTTGNNSSLCHQAFAWWSCSGSWRIGTAACLAFPWYPAPLTRSPVSTCTATRCWHSQPGTHDTVSTLIKIAPYLLEASLLHLDGKHIIACFSKTDESAANSFWKEKQALISPAEYWLHPQPITLTVWPKRGRLPGSDVFTLAHRYIHPEGLPSDYTITLLFRLLADTPEEPFALWEILNKNNEPLVGVILDSELRNTFICFHFTSRLKPIKINQWIQNIYLMLMKSQALYKLLCSTSVKTRVTILNIGKNAFV